MSSTRIDHYRRLAGAYIARRTSHLTFWHDDPEVTPGFDPKLVGHYPMRFREKADYTELDSNGIPVLDYHGAIGRQHNPIAVAQYGLGNYNLYLETQATEPKNRFLRVAEWLAESLSENAHGVPVWMHHFDWPYRETLAAPWYSGLAQGQGVSVLVRAHQETGENRYLVAAEKAMGSFQRPTQDGGVIHTDDSGDIWIEEYIVNPPTHILNGFIWGLWGVRDFALATGDQSASELWDRSIHTLETNLHRFDTGYWSLYELAGKGLPMVASTFYHRLHIVQLDIMARMTGRDAFAQMRDRWGSYEQKRWKKLRARTEKVAFKLLYY